MQGGRAGGGRPEMSRRVTNLALLAITGGLVASGLIGWLLPEGVAIPLYAAHRVLGVALVIALAAKYGIARASVARRWRRGRAVSLIVGSFASVALVITMGLGLGWTLGLVSFDAPWSYSALNVHVFLGLALFLLVAIHTALRWERRPPIARSGPRDAPRPPAGPAAAILPTPTLQRLPPARRATGSEHT